MKTGKKNGRRSAPGHRWKAKWLPTELNKHHPRLQIFRVAPSASSCAVVEVRLCRTRLDMYAAMWLDGGCVFSTDRTVGLCRTFRKRIEWGHSSETPRRQRLEYRHTVARIYLNKKDLRWQGADTVAHEAGHAALCYARWRQADLRTVNGEETMCYALGYTVQAITNRLHARRAFDR